MKGWMKRIKSLLKEKCGTFNPMWSNGQQQDAGHFLLFLLEKLDEDLLLEDGTSIIQKHFKARCVLISA